MVASRDRACCDGDRRRRTGRRRHHLPPSFSPGVDGRAISGGATGVGPNFGTRGFAISPDGTRIAYSTPEGLRLRSLSEFDATLIVPTADDLLLHLLFRLTARRSPFFPLAG